MKPHVLHLQNLSTFADQAGLTTLHLANLVQMYDDWPCVGVIFEPFCLEQPYKMATTLSEKKLQNLSLGAVHVSTSKVHGGTKRYISETF